MPRTVTLGGWAAACRAAPDLSFRVLRWALIASKMQVKGSKQCRRRWQNYLNAEVKQGGWTTEEVWAWSPRYLPSSRSPGGHFSQLRGRLRKLLSRCPDSLVSQDELLLEGHRKVGNRWTEIAKMVQGRTDNAVKNRFAVLVKKQARAPRKLPGGAL